MKRLLKGFIVIKDFIEEIFLLSLFPLSWVLRCFIKADLPGKDVSTKPIVVFVSGWGGFHLSYLKMKKNLEAKGFTVYLPYLGFEWGNIVTTSKKLAKYINQKGLKDFIIVALSEGTLVSLFYMQKLDGNKRIKKLLALGGPFQGTPIAYLISWFSKAGRQFSPHSEFLKELYKNGLKNPEKIVCVSAGFDEQIPRWSSHLPGVTHEITDTVGHMRLALVSDAIFGLINKYFLRK